MFLKSVGGAPIVDPLCHCAAAEKRVACQGYCVECAQWCNLRSVVARGPESAQAAGREGGEGTRVLRVRAALPPPTAVMFLADRVMCDIMERGHHSLSSDCKRYSVPNSSPSVMWMTSTSSCSSRGERREGKKRGALDSVLKILRFGDFLQSEKVQNEKLAK